MNRGRFLKIVLMLVGSLFLLVEHSFAENLNENKLVADSNSNAQRKGLDHEFYPSVLVDFIDDALELHFTPKKIEQMMEIFQQIGVKRVYWQHYGGSRANLKLWSGFGSTKQSRDTLQSLGGLPVKVAAEKAKKVGLEFYAVIRPYENGLSRSVSAGSPNVSAHPGAEVLGGAAIVLMDFVSDHPEMRIKRRMTMGTEEISSKTIERIKLIKNNDGPTRIDSDHIEIWTSPDNYRYQKKRVTFKLTDRVEPASHDFVSFGKIKTAAGSKVRVITLDGLSLTDKYILITTTFGDEKGDFRNLSTEILRAYDSEGTEIPTTVATSYGVWNQNRNFRTNGLAFDTGFGSSEFTLDVDSSAGTKGFIAICRGKNKYLPAALCEAYPEVREFWLQMVKECIEAGVDGIDFRVQCHSTWTDEPFAYGFNQPIVDQYKKQYGTDISTENYDVARLAALRGEFYTTFLRSAAKMLHGAGKKVQVHINTDLLNPKYTRRVNPFSYPRNITFDWEKWLDEGIADEATLRSLVLKPNEMLTDAYSQRVIQKCNKMNVPLHFNRYLNQVGPTFSHLQNEMELIRHDGRFQSFILYEGKRLIGPGSEDSVTLRGGRFGTMQQWKELIKGIAPENTN